MRGLLRFAAIIVAFALAPAAPATTFVVSNTADSGPGSLRQAMLDANAAQVTGPSACAPHQVVFSIPGTGPHAIQPLSPLPVIDIAIEFNGLSQPGSVENSLLQGSNAVLRIEIDGSLAGPADGFVLRSRVPGVPGCGGAGSIFRGLVINRWQGAAISVGETACPLDLACISGGVRILGNHIGTDASGMMAAGNGIALGRPTLAFGRGSTFNIVGEQVLGDGGATSPTPLARNVIAAGGSHAIQIASPVATQPAIDHRIRNNYIGLNAQGTAMLPNAGDGVRLAAGTSSTQVVENLIAGNTGSGIRIDAGAVGVHALAGNGIGIGVGGVALGNGGDGIRIEGPSGTATVARVYPFNTGNSASISANGGAGIRVDGPAWVDVLAASVDGNAALELDLSPTGVTPNDPGDGDTGPNTLLNTPTLVSAAFDVATLTGTITGTLSTTPSTGNIEVHYYLSEACDPSGSGGGKGVLAQGQVPVISTNITTDAGGMASFTRTTPFLPPGRFLTALTRLRAPAPGGGNALVVSEFSNCIPIVALTPLIFASGFE